MKILVIDNYDSFTYNLVHIVREITNEKVEVVRNDEITPEEVVPYDRILLSPGPGIPDEAGIMKTLIEKYAPTKSILGICLGMQGIAEIFGAKLFNMKKVFHGIKSDISILKSGERLFHHLPGEFKGGRYHSWAVEYNSLPDELEVTAIDKSGIIMGISHKRFDVKGLQFHPESVMTPYGKQILTNWLTPDSGEVSLTSSKNKAHNIYN